MTEQQEEHERLVRDFNEWFENGGREQIQEARKVGRIAGRQFAESTRVRPGTLMEPVIR